MSSEESGVDDNGDDILLVKPLPWRSGECNRMFIKIDGYNMACKSPASRRQQKKKQKATEDSRRELSAETKAGLPDFALEQL